MSLHTPFISLVLASLLTALSAQVALGADDPHGEPAIVRGEEVSPLAFPEVVGLSIPLATHPGQYRDCGGTIVNDTWVLSAAHCFVSMDESKQVRVTTQTGFSHGNDGKVYARPINSDQVFVHPDFLQDFQAGGPTRGKYDVALIRLTDPVSSTKPVDPATQAEVPRHPGANLMVPVVTLAQTGSVLPRSGPGILAGRGASRWIPANPLAVEPGDYDKDNTVLRKATLPIQRDCRSDYHLCAGERIDITPIENLPVGERHDATNHRLPSSCVGDSGGPLFVEDALGKRTQVGIISHARFSRAAETFWEKDTCGRVGTWYTAISYVRPWIDAVISANPRTPADLPIVNLQVPPTGTQPSPTPSPQPTGEPIKPPTTPVPTPTPQPNPSQSPSQYLPSRSNDPVFLKTIPAPDPKTQSLSWTVNPPRDGDGSLYSVAASRLRDAYSEVYQAGDQGKRRTALIASEATMADALASGVLQRNATLFLTDPNRLESHILNELKSQGFSDVLILGGEVAIKPGVEKTLRDAGLSTTRIAGADRTQTAIEIAKHAVALQANIASSRFVARAFGDAGDETRSWADSIALGALSARQAKPVLLSPTNEIPTNVAQRLHTGVAVSLVGGPQALAQNISTQAATLTGVPASRIAGENRAGTAAAIAEHYTEPTHAIVIDGKNPYAWQLGFSLAGLAAERNAPILLTSGEVVPPETRAALEKLKIHNVICIGEKDVCKSFNTSKI